ncbi:MAG: hypothetical protein ABSA16_11265 [Thermoguttaceae bacterium]|jgi:hypothetical protein
MTQRDYTTEINIHWNKMQVEADHKVCVSLASFVSERVLTYPKDEKAFIEARNQLYAYYSGAMSCLSATLQHPHFPYKEQLSSLNAKDYLFLICSLHTHFEISLFLTRRNERNAEQWLNIMLDGICEMYGRPFSYFEDWYDKLHWFTENENRVVIKMYDEIKSILNLPVDYLVEPMRWMQLSIAIAEGAKSIREQPNWSKLVDDRLAL